MRKRVLAAICAGCFLAGAVTYWAVRNYDRIREVNLPGHNDTFLVVNPLIGPSTAYTRQVGGKYVTLQDEAREEAEELADKVTESK